MPQFDQVDTFVGQIFWLFVTFAALYLVLSYVILPRMAATLEQRANKIEGDLAEAAKMREEANEVRANYEAQLSQARAEALEAAKKVADEVSAETAARTAELQAELDAQAAEAEASIRAARDAALAELPEIANETTMAMVTKLVGSADKKAVTSAVSASS